jgi:hypothetical protein
MKFTISGFSGAIQALHAKLLPEQIGVDSRNQKPGRGDLRPWNQPLTVATVPGGTQTIYRWGRGNAVDNQYWLHFNSVAHVVRLFGNVAGSEPTCISGTTTPSPAGGLKYIDATIIADGDLPYRYWPVGLAAPTSIPTISVATAGTSTQMETVYYTFTWVWNGASEESAPSPASLPFTCRVDDTLNVGNFGTPPTLPTEVPAGAAIIGMRVYRTKTGDVGDTDFFLVYDGTTAAAIVDNRSLLGEPLETTEWVPPDTAITTLTVMWNGMLAGIVGGKVRFCEPFVHYAWPLRYEISPPDASAVALGRWEQNLLVLTTAKPLLVTGTAPDSLDEQPLEIGEACIAPRGVVSFGHGVAWPSTDGLIYFGNGGGKNLTAGIFTRDDWQALNPSTMVASQYMGAYVCFYTDGSSVRRGFMIDPLNPTGVYFLDTGYDAMWFDELQDKLYILNGTNVQKWDAGASAMTATFRSKTLETPPSTMGALRVDADAFPVTVKVDAGPFTSGQATAIAAASGGLLTSTGTAVRYTVTLNDRDPVRLPGGFRATDWVVQVETTLPVQTVILANNIEELA